MKLLQISTIWTATSSSIQRWYFNISVLQKHTTYFYIFDITWPKITFFCLNLYIFLATFLRNKNLKHHFFKNFRRSFKMCVEVGSASIIFRYLTSRLNIWTRKINLNGGFQCYFLASYLNFLVFFNFQIFWEEIRLSI